MYSFIKKVWANKYFKRFFIISKMVLFIFLLVLSIESGKFHWYFLGLMVYSTYMRKERFKEFLDIYWCMLKAQWNMPNKKPRLPVKK